MDQFLILLLLFVLAVLTLYVLSRATSRVVLRGVGYRWFLFLTWPGVVVHELSHAAACVLTLTRIYHIELFKPEGGTLGHVTHARSRNPLTAIAISIAPLFGVPAVMWLVTWWLVPAVSIASVGTGSAGELVASAFSIFAQLDYTVWQSYLFIILMVSLATHAAPSNHDLKYTLYGISILAIVGTLVTWLTTTMRWNVDVAVITGYLVTPLQWIVGLLLYGIIFSILALIIALAVQGIRSIIRV